MIVYTLIRAKRKTAAIHIRPDATLEVRAPLKMPKRDIDAFVASKEPWIRAHLEAARERNARKTAFALGYDGELLLRGKSYPIVDARFGFPPKLTSEQLKAAAIMMYKAHAREHISARVAHFAPIMGVTPATVKINGAKTRWGSCSALGNLNFSWRLIMAEDSAIDYVVVHELAHLRQMNHSPRFWAVVADIFPDYRERQKRIKALQLRLSTEDWG
ncbi:MAG: M48 family metallopeptidase [Oscillospiraceae bacterium]|nr:M48 family metallopeptidase [Oscillospiraceae bacterium]